MIIGVSLKETVDYISKIDRGENPTVWKLGALSKAEGISLMTDAIMQNGEIDTMAIQKKSPEIVKAGLREIKNYKINKDAEAKDYSEITDDLIDSIPMVLMIELASKIISLNFVSDIEEKN